MLEPERAPGVRGLQRGLGVHGTFSRLDQRGSRLRRNQGKPGADLAALAIHGGGAFCLRDRAPRIAAVEQRIGEQRGGTQAGGPGGILRLRLAQVHRGVLGMAAEEQRLAQEFRQVCVQVGQRGTSRGERFGSLVEIAGVEGRPTLDQQASRIARRNARPGSFPGLVRLSRYQGGDSLVAQSSRCRNLNLPEACRERREAKEVPHVNI